MASDRATSGTGAPRALISESQVEAMISLLTDSSDTVLAACRKGLRQHAELAEPLLRERLGESGGDESLALRAALLDVVGSRLEQPLVDHLVHAPDLAAGSVLIGRLVDPAANPEAVTAALDALAELPVQQREAVVLTKLDGKSVAEAAEIAGTTVGAMKVRAHRGYEALRRLLGKSEPAKAAGGGS